MTKLKKIGAILCVAATVFAFSGCDLSKSMSINVKKGDVYSVNIDTDSDTSIKVAGQSVDSKEKTNTTYDVNIKDVSSNGATMEYKYTSIKMNSESNGQTTSYDSKTADKDSEESKIYGGFIGKSFTVKVDKKGKIQEVNGVDEMINSIVDKLGLEDDQKEKAKELMSKSFGDEAIKSMLSQSMNYFPSKDKVSVGDTWTNNFDIKTLFPMSVKNNFKLADDKNDNYSVDVKSSVVADTKNNDIDIMGLKASVNLKGDMTGNIKINKSNGFLSNGTEEENISGNMTILPNDEIPSKMIVPMTLKENITYKTTKK